MKWILQVVLLVFVLCFIACKKEQSTQVKEKITPQTQLDLLNEQITKDSENSTLYFQRASIHFSNREYSNSIQDLERAIQLDSTQYQYYHLLADAYIDNYQSKKSIDVLNECLKVFPARIGTLLKLAEFQHFIEEYDNSFLNIQRILEQEPKNPEAYFMMGLNFKAIGEPERAINAFQTAVEENPEITDAWILLGQLFHQMENPIAIRYFDNAVRLDSNDVNALHARAHYYHQTGTMDRAEENYKHIIRKNKNYINAYLNLGLLYLEIDSAQMAFDQFNIGVQNAPAYAHAYYLRGLSFESLGNPESARLDYQQAINLDETHVEAKSALEALR